MKMKSVVLLVVALGCGLVAMLGVQQVMSGPADDQKPVTEVQVLVASDGIDPFSSLDDSNTTFKTVPKEFVPEGALTSRNDYLDKKLRYYAAKGDVIVASKLIDKNYKPTTTIPIGMRVVTVKVDQTKMHGGMLKPGDHVDVVLTYKSVPKNSRRPIQRTVTILQNVKVFATGNIQIGAQDADDTEIKAKSVSLLVNPSHGNLLMLAENKGLLTLALRNDNETTSEADIQPFDEYALQNLHAKSGGGSDQPNNDGGLSGLLGSGHSGLNSPKGGGSDQNSDDADDEPPKWTMTIFTGRNRRDVEVEDPNASVPDKKTRATDKPNTGV